MKAKPEQQSFFDVQHGQPGTKTRYIPRTETGKDSRDEAFRRVREAEPGREDTRAKGSGQPTPIKDLGPRQRQIYVCSGI